MKHLIRGEDQCFLVIRQQAPLSDEERERLRQADLSEEEIDLGIQAEIPVEIMLRAKRLFDENRRLFRQPTLD